MSTTADDHKAIRVDNPAALLTIVPRLLGFQPHASIVMVGTKPPRSRVALTVRYDLPDPPDPDTAAYIAGHASAVLHANGVKAVAAVGYGPDSVVTPVADATREAARLTGLAITEFLRVEDKRYWSYLCANSECCPPQGLPFDPDDGADVASLAGISGTRVLASREALAATIAPLGDEAAETMRVATRRAKERAARLAKRAAVPGKERPGRLTIVTAGTEAVRQAIDCYRRGDKLPAGNTAAWLTLVLHSLRIRDDAWARMDPAHRKAHLRLWTDITRLARPGYIAAPASLLAFVAWQSGDGALANVALDRAQSDDPDYSMAQLLRQAIDSGAPPSMARLPMTPEEVAASYEDLEENAGCHDEVDPAADDGSGADEATGDPSDSDAPGSVQENAGEPAV